MGEPTPVMVISSVVSDSLLELTRLRLVTDLHGTKMRIELRLTIASMLPTDPGSNRPARYRVTNYDDEVGFPDFAFVSVPTTCRFPSFL